MPAATLGRTLPRTAAPAALEQRLIDAALRCVGRWGVGKTTVDDMAREAGCSRATLYRVFPGGKEALMRAAVRREVDDLVAAVDRRMAGATGLEDALTGAVGVAGSTVASHPVLQFVLSFEPETILPHLAFAGMDRALSVVSVTAAPLLARWIPAAEAPRCAEWLCRVVVSYLVCPSPEVDFSDEQSVRTLVRRFVIPVLNASIEPPEDPWTPPTAN
ncbi:MAG TPA: TetR/AcrR family transcriptional regulator [Acidimicrobiales bacterium]|nr:TetR/AcrR family transcriptional regulator [Acidimicrobiales bacterium]